MSKSRPEATGEQSVIISGRKVKLAAPGAAKRSADKVKQQYAQALENLKNR
ncbi:MAG: hypothetical protein SV765_00115 [Pseudomonadota bacterium]|nr:hypothetical protein [Pseudomonadota bacterium]